MRTLSRMILRTHETIRVKVQKGTQGKAALVANTLNGITIQSKKKLNIAIVIKTVFSIASIIIMRLKTEKKSLWQILKVKRFSDTNPVCTLCRSLVL